MATSMRPPTTQAGAADNGVDHSNSSLQPGMRVRVKGLSMRTELNGHEGTLLDFDATERRWRIVSDTGTGWSLKPENVEEFRDENANANFDVECTLPERAPDIDGFLVGARVRIVGLQARPQLNGREGRLHEYSKDACRWKILLDDGVGLSVQLANLKLLPSAVEDSKVEKQAELAASQGTEQTASQATDMRTGARVRIVGLISRSDLNGKEGCLLEYNSVEGRWQVWMDDGTGKLLRPAHLLVLPAAAEPPSAGDKASSNDDSGREYSLLKTACDTSETALSPFVVGARVTVQGIVSRSELNGREGSLLQWNSGEGRWHLMMDNGASLSLRPDNLKVAKEPSDSAKGKSVGLASTVTTRGDHSVEETSESATNVHASTTNAHGNFAVANQLDPGGTSELSPGARVKAVGLRARPELNGRIGTLLEYIEHEERWRVAMDDSNGLSLKYANIEVLSCVPSAGAAKDSETERPSAAQKVQTSDFGYQSSSAEDLKGRETLIASHPNIESQDVGNACSAVMGQHTSLKERFDKFVSTGERICIPDMPSLAPKTENERSLVVGTRVRVIGLAKRPELNGQVGKLFEFNSSEGRWQVIMDSGSGLCLRVANIEPLNVEPCGETLESSVVSHEKNVDDEAEKIGTAVGSGQSIRSAPIEKDHNVVESSQSTLTIGTRVRLAGLKMRPELNGRLGDLLEFAPSDGRWKVVMEDGSGLFLRPESLVAVADALDDQLTSPCLRAKEDSLPQVASAPTPTVVDNHTLVAPGSCPAENEVGVWDWNDLGEWEIEEDFEMEPPITTGNVATANMLKPGFQQCFYTSIQTPRHQDVTAAASATLEEVAAIEAGDWNPHDILQVGRRVEIKGLSKRQDLNGCQGSLLTYDAVDERWKVVMDDGSGLSLRALNLELAPDRSEQRSGTATRPNSPTGSFRLGSRVRIKNAPGRPQLNDDAGSLIAYDQHASLWSVALDDGFREDFRAEHLELIAADHNRTVGEQDASRSNVGDASSSYKAGMRVLVTGLVKRSELNGQEGRLLEYDAVESRWKVVMDNGSGLSLRPAHLVVVPNHPNSCQLGGVTEDSHHRYNAEESVYVSALHVGDRVRITGLSGRADLNGKEGSLHEYHADEDRWNVVMDDGSGLSLRALNLEAVPISQQCDAGNSSSNVISTTSFGRATTSGTAVASNASAAAEYEAGMQVRVTGLVRRNELNGKEGRLLEYDERELRWKVLMDDGSGLSLRPDNFASVTTRPIDSRNASSSSSSVPLPTGADDVGIGARRDTAAANVVSSVSAVPTSSSSVPSLTSATLQSGALVELVGLHARPDLNGQRGTLARLDTDGSGRWEVVMQDGSLKMLKPRNLLSCTEDSVGVRPDDVSQLTEVTTALPTHVDATSRGQIVPGALVRLLGLRSQSDLNGQEATVLEFCPEEDRWRVVTGDGRRLAVVEHNLRLVRPSDVRLVDV